MKIIGSKNNSKYFAIVLPFILVGLLYLLLTQKSKVPQLDQHSTTSDDSIILCDVEHVKNGKLYFKNKTFGDAQLRSKEQAHSGKYSLRLAKDANYGFVYQIDAPEPGANYKVEVWRKHKSPTDSHLVVEGSTKEKLYISTQKEVANTGDWWEKLEIIFSVPLHVSLDYIKIYTFKTKGPAIVYFDDLKITKLGAIKHLDTTDFTPPILDINIPLKGLRTLEKTKLNALSKTVYIKKKDDLIKAFIDINGIKRKMKMRYKGDWLDHMMSNRPSYRIELGPEDSWQRLKTFSIQAPSTRGHLRAWVYRQFLKSEDILTPRIDYCFVRINNKKPQIYSYEEHFTKNLLEYQLRREGPILKMTEDRLWDALERTRTLTRQNVSAQMNSGNITSSEIKPFDEKKTLKSDVLHNQFITAQNLLNQFKLGKKSAPEIFDIEREAKFLAITDICIAQHGLAWHNLRYYYNPVTSLIEPIGYDGYSGAPPIKLEQLYCINIYRNTEIYEPLHRIFYDPDFMEAYFKAMYTLSQTDYINLFFAQINKGIQARQDFIRQDEKDYVFNTGEIKQKAMRIQEMLLPFKNSLISFTEKRSKDSIELKVANTHLLPIKIIGYAKKEAIKETLLPSPLYLYPPKWDKKPLYKNLNIPTGFKLLMYQLPGVDSTFYKTIGGWPAPNDKVARQDLSLNNTPDLNIFELTQKTYTLPLGNYSFDNPIYIPRGYGLNIESGSNLSFKDDGLIIVNGPLKMLGTKMEPINFKSIDGKSGSIVVLQSKTPSTLNHVIFDNQNTITYKGWHLTGAVSFYESDVSISHCQFINNQCEDALNIVRCDFKVTDCLFKNVFSDAFDSDYSTGHVLNVNFDNVGNDAIDFSTSQVLVEKCTMTSIGDKGISGGENATIVANDINIDGANIGFAAKDLSLLTLDRINLKNCKTGFTAYQKKPEYGPANIKIKSSDTELIEHLYMVENGSSIKNIEG